MKRFCVFLAVVLCCAGVLRADERILMFHSDVSVNQDGSLDVVETIQVRAEGNQIRHGIYRDFPLRYRGRQGGMVRVGFNVSSVTRDRKTEPYHSENRMNGIRLYFGDKDVFLSNGIYTYQFAYHTTDQLGFFDGYDEIYWNVTGNDWEFPIDRTSALITLPAQVAKADLRIAGYTGAQGEQGTDYVADVAGRAIEFQTTRALGVHEGLTAAVGFPKGVVHEPTPAEIRMRTARTYIADIIAGGFFVLSLMANLLVWRRHGKDPDRGTIIPRFKPPDGMSPAECRYMATFGYDARGFTANLIHLAVNGWVDIRENDGRYTAVKNATGKSRTSDEEALMTGLFSSGDIVMFSNHEHSVIGRAMQAVKQSLEKKFKNTLFHLNLKYILVPFSMAFIMVLGVVSAIRNPVMFVPGLMFMLYAIVIDLLWRYATANIIGSGRGTFYKARHTVMLVFLAAFTGTIMVGMSVAVCYSIGMQVIGMAAFAGTIAQIPIFARLFRRPTEAGQVLRDEIAGFRLYLSVAERDQLASVKGPERTIGLFEAFLPYALALGVEQEWAENFSDIVKAAGEEYQPAWYRGRSWRNASDMTHSIGRSFERSIASASVAPGSSSGSGGGGSSGGGGGGGGGGGW